MLQRKILERDVEKALVERIKLLGGTAEKFTSPGQRSVPDRLITLPGNRISFAECKRPRATPTKNQARDHKRRRKLGCVVNIIDSYEAIDNAYPI